MQAKLDAGLVSGVLNLETGRVRKWRNNGQRQRGWRERKEFSGKIFGMIKNSEYSELEIK